MGLDQTGIEELGEHLGLLEVSICAGPGPLRERSLHCLRLRHQDRLLSSLLTAFGVRYNGLADDGLAVADDDEDVRKTSR